ncbi:SphA family protein [Acinetobacter zhairhuonensis]|uniref:SphA family protein n=1 Tax=Acinetobacter sp. A7.4 TaxID=2919921 RepID=UPI001F4E3B5A|nr:transporter [Acinetobacter sp. A7.4]MCJ8160473.1 transporter [Acinetobacter sp. A7.4]
MNNKIAALLCGLLTSFHVSTASATENGSDSFSLGAEGIMAGALPPAGLYFLGYYQNYHANEFIDGPSQFHVDANALVPRLVWMTNYQIAHGQWGMYAAQPLVDLKVNINGLHDSNQGLGDLYLGTMLGWHHQNHHWLAALETVLGTGDYKAPSQTNPVRANIGKNYDTIRPIFAYSYINPNGLDLSTKISYSWNNRNDATDYKSGEYFAGDYSLGYRIQPKVKVAVEGYYFKQTKEDNINGEDIDFKGQAFAIGPAIQYADQNWSLEAKFLKETNVENRPEGHTSWLKLVWAF